MTTQHPRQKNKQDLVLEYLSNIERLLKSGEATELSYRDYLWELLRKLLEGYEIINDAKRIVCGAPDLMIKKGAAQIAFIETKPVDDTDLEGNKGNKEQFDRYRNALDVIAFTNFLNFRLYIHGNLMDEYSFEIGKIQKDKAIKPNKKNFDKFFLFIDELKKAKPQKITNATSLAEHMASKAHLLKNITCKYLDAIEEQGGAGEENALYALYNDFKNILNSNLEREKFADIYAQTLTYALFVARLNDKTPDNFTREEALKLIPQSNPFLKNLFTYIHSYLDNEIAWVVDDIVNLFAVSDVAKIMKNYKPGQGRDPMIHFYEDFLEIYDKETRENMGVWYTPLPIVKYIIKSVDQILEKHFDIEDGLANDSSIKIKVKVPLEGDTFQLKEKQIPRLQILDPATGTGTFLAECVLQIFDKFKFNRGKWSAFVKNCLIPRLNGFEILMASYTMAHLKLDLVLKSTGYVNNDNQRFNIFLTDSLKCDYNFKAFSSPALRIEAINTYQIKEDYPIMIVIGNPPYNGESENKDKFIMDLMKDYKKEPGSNDPIKEKNIKWLNNDYVKFIRLAEYYINNNGIGIIAFITPDSFLYRSDCRCMRYHLMETFNQIYILDLHGNARSKKKEPEEEKDKNIFKIMEGVSINIFIKTNNDKRCKVYYTDVHGDNRKKLDFLSTNSFDSIDYKETNPVRPDYYFIPLEEKTTNNEWFDIKEFFITQSVGMLSFHDELNYSFSEDEQKRKIRDITKMPENQWREVNHRDKDSRDWVYEKAKKDAENSKGKFLVANYRPFDPRFTFYTGVQRGLYGYPRNSIMQHFIGLENTGLIIGKQGNVIGNGEWDIVFITDKITDANVFYRGGGYIFPLYLYKNEPQQSQGNLFQDEEFGKVVNFKKEIYERILAKLDYKPTNEAILDYIYAVLYTPEYRQIFKESLKIKFPKIPYPQNTSIFKKLADIGSKLRTVHLMKDKRPSVKETIASFPEPGSNTIEKIKFDSEKVFINETQHFANVPQDVFDMFIGGYQPAQKYLKDRKGRQLSQDELNHYQRIVLALKKTLELMSELSELSSEWLEQG